MLLNHYWTETTDGELRLYRAQPTGPRILKGRVYRTRTGRGGFEAIAIGHGLLLTKRGERTFRESRDALRAVEGRVKAEISQQETVNA